MFEAAKFNFHAGMVLDYFKAAARAKEVGNDQKTLLLLKKAMQAGQNVLSIKSPEISDEQRATVQIVISSVQKLYQLELVARMPEEDRELLMSVLKSWSDMGIATIGVHPLDQMIGMFEIAKNRLDKGDKGKEVLGIIYESDHVPAPLRNIMQPFLAGEASQEETAKRLDECTAKLRKWMPELFPGEPLPAR